MGGVRPAVERSSSANRWPIDGDDAMMTQRRAHAPTADYCSHYYQRDDARIYAYKVNGARSARVRAQVLNMKSSDDDDDDDDNDDNDYNDATMPARSTCNIFVFLQSTQFKHACSTCESSVCACA